MEAPWLTVINKALAAAGAARSFGKYLGKIIRRLLLIDQKVDREEIENLGAYIKVFDAYAKSMKRSGATQSDIRAASEELLTPKLRAYLLVHGITEVEKLRSSQQPPATGVPCDIIESCAAPLPQTSPHVERRAMQLAPDQESHQMKRIGDPERER